MDVSLSLPKVQQGVSGGIRPTDGCMRSYGDIVRYIYIYIYMYNVFFYALFLHSFEVLRLHLAEPQMESLDGGIPAATSALNR